MAADTAQVNTLMRQVDASIANNISQAQKSAREALSLSERLNYASGIIRSSLAVADIQTTRGYYDEANELILKSIALSEQLGDEFLQAKSHLGMYRLLFERGQYALAAEANKKAEAIGVKLNNQEILAYAYCHDGVITSIGGNRRRGLELLFKSLEMFRAQKNETMTGVLLTRVGVTFDLAGNTEKSFDYLRQSLVINERLNNYTNAGWSTMNIGVCYTRLDSIDRGLEYYDKALKLAELGENLRLMLACLDNMGGKYSMRGEFAKASAFLMRAYNLSKRAGHNSRTVYIAGNLAEHYLLMKRYDSAEMFSKENLRIAIQENNAFEKRQAYLVLADIYATTRKYDKAYAALLEHVDLTDSIFTREKSQQVEELREKYETEKKEQAIESLTQAKASEEFRKNAFAVLAVSFFIVAFLVFYILRSRVKRNRLLLEKEMEVDRMKSRFFANISHEFRTPLTLILGPVDDLLAKPEHAPLQKYLDPMKRNASRLLELVNQLLDLSKIESGKLKPRLAKQNIGIIVRGVTMSFASMAESKGVDLKASSDDIELFVDRDKIEKILFNLLSNAFKFTPESGTISVTVQRKTPSIIPGVSDCLEIVVADTGRGIPAGEIDHIFDRFYQADNNQLLQQDGSGIGLALTKELVELHHGAIKANSTVGSGTEIRIQLPMNLDQVMKDCIDESTPVTVSKHEVFTAEETTQSPESEIDSLKPIILLIEDHAEVRRYVHDTLSDQYNVIEAGDGKEGVDMAINQIPDLILCDVMMPRMDGHQVCKKLKGEEKTSHIPIILLTAKADVESRIEGLETRADDYLTKPFVAKELLARIHNLIESRRALREKYLHTMVLTPNEVAVTSVDEQFLKRLMAIVENHVADEKFGVEEMSEQLAMSRSQLHRKLKALIGQGPNQYIRSFRLKRAHDLLQGNAATAAEIAYSVGFSSPSYFTKCFHEQFGYTPSEVPAKL